MFIPDKYFQYFSIPDPRSKVKNIPDPGSASKIFVFLTQKIVSKLSEIWSGMFNPDHRSRIRILIFLPTPDPVVKKTPDPGSGSATLFSNNRFFPQTWWDPGWIRPWSSWCRWCPPPCTGDPSRPPQLPRCKMMKNQRWKSQRVKIHEVSLWIFQRFLKPMACLWVCFPKSWDFFLLFTSLQVNCIE